jgi:hypothetical protein
MTETEGMGFLRQAYDTLSLIHDKTVQVTGPLNGALEILAGLDAQTLSVISGTSGLPAEAAALRGRSRALVAGIEQALVDATTVQETALTMMKRIRGA